MISETGLAAWMLYDTNAVTPAHSHIGVYQNGEFMNLTEEVPTVMYGANKPYVRGDTIVFLANHQTYDKANTTWRLVEVPNRDEGDFPEIDAVYNIDDGNTQQLSLADPVSTNEDAVIVGQDQSRARRIPSGEAEVWRWSSGEGSIARVTQDGRNDFSPSFDGDVIAWQKAKGWPFGWEIMALIGNERVQLTTNYYYDMGPRVHANKIVWYGWDGFDYEIFLHDTETGETTQITSNRYDDVAPMIWNDVIVWEGYPAVEADIFLWKDGEIKIISNNIDDDLLPRIWENKVVWQGFDGDDFEIYLYDIEKDTTIQVTGNRYDDTNPEIADDLLVWMGYEGNWDAEIFYQNTRNISQDNINPVQLTDNEEDDREPHTAGQRIIWVADEQGQSAIMLAEPR